MSQINQESFKTIRERYGMTPKFFKKTIKAIRKKLDACVGHSRYRNLTPKQVKILEFYIEGSTKDLFDGIDD